MREDDSDRPEESSYHAFVSRGEYRDNVKDAREWRSSMEARLIGIEKKLTIGGLVLAALAAGHDIPWPKIAQALGW